MYMALLYQCTRLESKTTQSLQLQPSDLWHGPTLSKKEYGQKNDVEIQAVTNQRVIHNTADHGDTSIYLKETSIYPQS